MKNRLPDVLPFDHTRVELPTTKDDYINASHIRNLPAHSPRFIATQSPTAKTLTDFWTMVWQESVETMVCLIPELDFTYWPQDRKEPIRVEPDLEITLQSTKTEPLQPFVERIFTVMNKTSHTSRVVIHLQLNLQPNVNAYVQVATTCLGYHRQQRVMSHPVLVHCLAGSGKTAVFLLIAAAMAEMEVGHMPDLIPDMVNLTGQICQQRKGILREKEHLKQAVQGVIKHAKSILIKGGKLPPETPEIPPSQASKSSHEIGDLSTLSTQLGFKVKNPIEIREENKVEQIMESNETKREKSGIFSSDLSKLADLNISNTSTPSPKKKVTKQDFMNASKGLKNEADAADPLSQLDPLWSLK